MPILPRFFLVTAQSGVKGMLLQLDGVKERAYSNQYCQIEAPAAAWQYKYSSGYVVTLRGPLTAQVNIVPFTPEQQQLAPPGSPNYTLKIHWMHFEANTHERLLSVDGIVGTRREEGAGPQTPRLATRIPPLLQPNQQQHQPAQPHQPNGIVKVEEQEQQEQLRRSEKRVEESRVYISQCTIPAEPVNAFGIPQATMRCLEVSLVFFLSRSSVPLLAFV